MSMISRRRKPSTPFLFLSSRLSLTLGFRINLGRARTIPDQTQNGVKVHQRSRYVWTLVLLEGFLRIWGMSQLWTLRWNHPGSIEGSFFLNFYMTLF